MADDDGIEASPVSSMASTPYPRLARMIASGKITAPARDSFGRTIADRRRIQKLARRNTTPFSKNKAEEKNSFEKGRLFFSC
jgi:hypothetical protein